MFAINSDKSIYLTRGDDAIIEVSVFASSGEQYIFSIGDVVKFKVCEKNHCDRIVMEKTVLVGSERQTIDIDLDPNDTKFGPAISKPKDYWYEIELTHESVVQTVVGYDTNGPKIFRLYPEGVED